MLSLVPVVLLFFQAQGSMPSPAFENLEREQMMRRVEPMSSSTPSKEADRRAIAYEEQQFVNKFNNLMKRLLDFAGQYNAGHTVDAKRIKEVKKAWRDLEKTDAWFKPEVDGGCGHAALSQSSH